MKDFVHAVADAVSVVLVYIDRDYRYRFVNRAYIERYGRNADCIGRTIREVVGDEQFAAVEPDLRRALGGEAITSDSEIPRPGRSPLAITATFVPVRGSDGTVEGVAIFSEDVTERRDAERRVIESERQLRLLADVIPQMVWVTSPDGRAEYMNARWYEYTRGSATGGAESGWHDVVHPDDLERVLAAHRRAVAERAPFEVEYRIRRHDGVYRWHLARTVFISDVDGNPIKRFGTATDIDDQKRTEERLERGSRVKDEFLAMLGHELRNPLAPIVTALELMTLREEPAFIRERTIIERQVKQLSRLVDDLLDVSRIATGRIAIERKRTAVGEIVTRAVEMAQPLLEQRRHRLAVTVTPDLSVIVDAARIAQVLSNLLANAAKFTAPGGNIELSVVREGEHVVVGVKDDGIGVEPELLPRVFELFTQGPQGFDRKQGGLGLGLAIARNIVDLHGGSIDVRSEGTNRGTEVVVRLPLAGIEATAAAEITPKPAPTQRLSRGSILVVDDNEDAADLLSFALEEYGYVTKVAHDGDGALAIMSGEGAFRPDLAVLDLGLPTMDGFELARQLRARPELAGLRLIALTGYGQADDRARTKEAGFDEHLVKPVDLAHLESTVAALLKPR